LVVLLIRRHSPCYLLLYKTSLQKGHLDIFTAKKVKLNLFKPYTQPLLTPHFRPAPSSSCNPHTTASSPACRPDTAHGCKLHESRSYLHEQTGSQSKPSYILAHAGWYLWCGGNHGRSPPKFDKIKQTNRPFPINIQIIRPPLQH